MSGYYTLNVFSVAISVCLCSSLGLALCCTENIVREFLWIQCVCLCSSLDLALCCAEKEKESEEFCPGATESLSQLTIRQMVMLRVILAE